MLDTLVPRLVSRVKQGITEFSFDGAEWLTASYGALGQNLVMEKIYES